MYILQHSTRTKRTQKSRAHRTHTLTQPHTCPLTIPMHIFPLTKPSSHNHPKQPSIHTCIYICTCTLYLEDRHNTAWWLVYTCTYIQLPSVCKHRGSVCNFLLSDITGRLMAHCRTVSGHLYLHVYVPVHWSTLSSLIHTHVVDAHCAGRVCAT